MKHKKGMGEIMDKEKGISNFPLDEMPAYDPKNGFNLGFSPYTLEDFRSFYRKICSQLKASESELLFKLSKSSESDTMSHSNLIGYLGQVWHSNLPRPFDEKMVKEAKESYLHGLLCGASMDYLEVVSDEFRVIPIDARLIGDDNSMLFISSRKKDGSVRSLGELIKVAEGIGTETAHYGAYVSHHVDRNDYALVGKRLSEAEYQKRLHEWGLDVSWD